LPEGVQVRVVDVAGVSIEGVQVRFAILTGGGALSTTGDRTDSTGVAGTIWVLGPEAGAQTLRASVGTLQVDFAATAEAPAVGDTLWGTSAFVEYIVGELPIILGAPHGGYDKPSSLADRTSGVTGQDRRTQEFARTLADSLEAVTGKRPHMIVSRLHRSKLDPNREVVEAAQGDPGAERAWWEFQSFIELARGVVTRDHGDGLFLDLHGHAHPNPRIELGYLLNSDDLERLDGQLDAQAGKSSLRALAENTGSFSALIRGESSLGALLEQGGFSTVPSPTQPHPGGEPYFNGGYNTARHGSRDGGTVSGAQIEMPWPGVRELQGDRERLAGVLSAGLVEFFEVHYQRALGVTRP